MADQLACVVIAKVGIKLCCSIDKKPLVCVQTFLHANHLWQTFVKLVLYGVIKVLIIRLPAATSGSCHVSLCKCSQAYAWHREDILPVHDLIQCTFNMFKL